MTIEGTPSQTSAHYSMLCDCKADIWEISGSNSRDSDSKSAHDNSRGYNFSRVSSLLNSLCDYVTVDLTICEMLNEMNSNSRDCDSRRARDISRESTKMPTQRTPDALGKHGGKFYRTSSAASSSNSRERDSRSAQYISRGSTLDALEKHDGKFYRASTSESSSRDRVYHDRYGVATASRLLGSRLQKSPKKETIFCKKKRRI